MRTFTPSNPSQFKPPSSVINIGGFSTQPQSPERQRLMEALQEISLKLTLREKQLEALSQDQEESYNPGPAKRTFVVKARYRRTGKASPLVYPLDDE
ncbi:MAG: hypothetical protein RLZZ511_1999 [Cyanobacteriota bacterium]|jgi:hypothetical protein